MEKTNANANVSEKAFKPRQWYCNVLMRDYQGRHRLNDDFPWDFTIRKIAERYGFEFAPGSVQINGVPIDDSMLDVHLRTFLGFEDILLAYRRTARILIMGNDLSQFKKPKPKETTSVMIDSSIIVEESEDDIE